MDEFASFFLDVFRNFYPFSDKFPIDSDRLIETLGQTKYEVAALVTLTIIVFVETGLLIGFFLPGDSLLVIAGIVAAASGWDLPLLLVSLCAAAIIGDSVGYYIGYKSGPKIFCREKSWFFAKDHLLRAQEFYERHGGKTIILARFIPILRTFAPVVAGVGRMDYRRFLFYNIFGGIGWVVSMILIGYYLDPVLRLLFGPSFRIEKHIDKVIIIVVLLSISPGVITWVRNKVKGKSQETSALASLEPAESKSV